jgi:hypothetical protein
MAIRGQRGLSARERFLDGVFRFVVRGEHSVAVDVQLTHVPLGKSPKVDSSPRAGGGQFVGLVHRHLSIGPYVMWAIDLIMPPARSA